MLELYGKFSTVLLLVMPGYNFSLVSSTPEQSCLTPPSSLGLPQYSSVLQKPNHGSFEKDQQETRSRLLRDAGIGQEDEAGVQVQKVRTAEEGPHVHGNFGARSRER